jgi:putative inorganic carbon (hco3(-)) transporter
MTARQFPLKLTEFGLILFSSTIAISHVPAQFAIAFAFLGWFLEGALNKNWQVRWNPLFLPLMLYVAWNIVCSLSSPRPLHSLFAVADNEWAVFIMIMMFWTVRDSTVLRKILIGLFISSSVAMVYAIWQSFFGIELYRRMTLDPMGHFYRSVGFYGFYLTFAAFAMSVFFVCSAFVIVGGWKGKWYRFILPILSFAAVVFTFARSIWLSFAGVIPFLGFVSGRKSDRWGAVVLLTVFAVSLLLVPTLRNRAASTFDLKANETRINLWETSLKVSHDFRIVGIGEDNFDYYFEKYKVPGYYDTTAHPHNDYLNVLINAGVPGLVFFLWLWIEVIRSGIATWRKSADSVAKSAALGGTLALVGLMIGALFQDYYGSFINCLGWWFVVGLVYAGVRVQEGRMEKDVVAL